MRYSKAVRLETAPTGRGRGRDSEFFVEVAIRRSPPTKNRDSEIPPTWVSTEKKGAAF